MAVTTVLFPSRYSVMRYLLIIVVWILSTNGFHVAIKHRDHVLLNGIKIFPHEIHNHLYDHERKLIFGSSNKTRSDVKIVHVRRKNYARRGRRSTESSKRGLLSVRLEDDSERSVQNLKSFKLIDDAFILIRRFANTSQFITNSHQLVSDYEKCFYRNDITALDLCDDERIRGIFHHNISSFLIEPLPIRFGKNSHVLYKPKFINNYNVPVTGYKTQQKEVNGLQFEPNYQSFNDIKTIKNENIMGNFSEIDIYKNYSTANNNNGVRFKRHISSQWKIPQVLHIETAIFVDKDLYKHMARNFPVATESHLIRFVLAMINGVQLLYHHPSLGHDVNFVLKRLEILHNDPKDLKRSSDIDIFLNNFCMWQRKLNPSSDADVVHYDHAVILTGLDLYVIGKNGKVSSQVVGLAPVAGMCTSTSSCTINEGKHFESVFVVAHEIGHNLGMRHDTSESSCDPSTYIMSPTLGSGKITWSKCSRSYLNAFLETTQSHCMFDRGKFGNSLDHDAEGIQPGERFDADQQCMLKYGKASIRARTQPFADICRDLHCQRDRYTWTSHPALEGTECGDMMWCKSGVCVMKAAFMESFSIPKQVLVASKHQDKRNFVEDKKLGNLRHEYNFNKAPAWSEWGEPSECESGCLYGSSGHLREEGSTGLKTFLRSCLDYKKRCVGRDRKYEACVARQCFNLKTTTIVEFATQICERAKKFDNDLTGDGLQNADIPDEDSCKVFCVTKTNGTKSRSWTFPDGTICRKKMYDFHDTSYCVNGRCESFSCENSSMNLFKMDSTFCSESLVQEETHQKNQIIQENGRDFKSMRSHNHKGSIIKDYPERLHNTPSVIQRKSDKELRHPSAQAHFNDHLDPLIKLNSWIVSSGCHFSCMEKAKGVQLITSKIDNSNNVQLCSPNTIPCDRLQTTNEYAENLCTRYKLKVRGLSGRGMQISASVNDPDRSCRIACQDEFLTHRFYLVNSDHGLFPFGTKCSPSEERYCISGKCLEFGPDYVPLEKSDVNLALVRSKRDIKNQTIRNYDKELRLKRSYLFYDPINITEILTQQYLDKVTRTLDFTRFRILDDIPILNEHIGFTNPIHVPIQELTNYA